MGIVVRGNTLRCLTGTAALVCCVALARAQSPLDNDTLALTAQTFDQTRDGQPTPLPTSRPSPASGAFLPAPTPARQEPVGDVTRDDQGEIVPLEETQRGPLTFSLTGLYMFGGMSGYAQTPLGHVGNSTSLSRPRFDSVGIDHSNIGDVEFDVSWQNQQIFLGAQYNHMSGNGVIGQSLVSHGVTFPTHANVHSQLRTDWYRLGYRYTFALNTAPNGVPDFTLTPWVDAFYWDYGFSLDSGPLGHAGKSLQKFGVQVGATVAWRPNGGPLSIEANFGSFPQNTRLATISTESLLARYHFYHWRHYDFNFLLGVAWEQQYFDDRERAVSNRIIANFGPMLLTGLQVNF